MRRSTEQCLTLAYVAGLFDAEGCIAVSPYIVKNKPWQWRYHCDLYLGMQNREAIEVVAKTLGGSISPRKDIFMWQISGNAAGPVMGQLLPFLRAKRKAGELFVEYAKTFRPWRLGRGHWLEPEILEARERLSKAIRELIFADAMAFRAKRVNSGKASQEVTPSRAPRRGRSRKGRL